MTDLIIDSFAKRLPAGRERRRPYRRKKAA